MFWIIDLRFQPYQNELFPNVFLPTFVTNGPQFYDIRHSLNSSSVTSAAERISAVNMYTRIKGGSSAVTLAEWVAPKQAANQQLIQDLSRISSSHAIGDHQAADFHQQIYIQYPYSTCRISHADCTVCHYQDSQKPMSRFNGFARKFETPQGFEDFFVLSRGHTTELYE